MLGHGSALASRLLCQERKIPKPSSQHSRDEYHTNQGLQGREQRAGGMMATHVRTYACADRLGSWAESPCFQAR